MPSFLPQTFDLIAHYEPRADFSVTASVRRALDELAKKHGRRTFMTGKHSGKPELHTDIRGISVGTRIELSRLVFRKASQRQMFADALRLFVEAADEGIASGPIDRVVLSYPKHLYRPEPRGDAARAFEEVFGRPCCFLTTPKRELEMGQVVRHQTLVEHLNESGAYHSDHLPRIEAVRHEVQKQPGRYENHRIFTRPVPVEGQRPQVEFCYTGDRPDNLVEVAMRQKSEERLTFVTREQVEAQPEAFISLNDYEGAARRYGTLWVLQGDLVRPTDRQRFTAIHLFMDEQGQPLMDEAFTWQALYDRMQHCPQISRGSRKSPSFLDLALHQLDKGGFTRFEDDRFRLATGFERFVHVTFYDMGSYDKRLQG